MCRQWLTGIVPQGVLHYGVMKADLELIQRALNEGPTPNSTLCMDDGRPLYAMLCVTSHRCLCHSFLTFRQ